ncbi:MAG: adenine deaminase [Chitinophagaceae bacterium]|nr:MAG: adenine deaminase [Chitinophagaceae bacterium]
MPSAFVVKGNIVAIAEKKVFFGEISIDKGKIVSIARLGSNQDTNYPYICPGFIDSHVHIESSMLVPSEFAKLAVVHGTTGTISDPHEIANVCGIQGVHYMIDNGKSVPFKFHFGAPSCVPATIFETAGAALDARAVDELLARPEIKYLSEMMNFPGVLHGDKEVMDKIASAKKYHKPVDGHAPGLRGEVAKKYIDAGISTDHECFTSDEALDKLHAGMKILIREGSAAKNFEALIGLLEEHYENMMFCSDDKHPDSLVAGHINVLCARAVAKGIDVFKVLTAACINPVIHYKMENGILREGDPADFVVLKDLEKFEVMQTYINGELVAENGRSLIETTTAKIINEFECSEKIPELFSIKAQAAQQTIPVIEALDGQLITNKLDLPALIRDGALVSNPEKDILKIVVVNRYQDAPIARAFIKNFGIKKGALASSVAHDSHNIVAVGVDDKSLCRAVNLIIQQRGGVSAVTEDKEMVLGLPVAGLMSVEDGYKVAADYTEIDRFTKEVLGSSLSAPFMTLSFMALLVIPHLKLSDKGLFDGDEFKFIPD